uniref:Uncharacterized protein n=1 Tax=Oryza punctata TaxID=4537 RepID=A0A0E0KQC9_ORYPU
MCAAADPSGEGAVATASGDGAAQTAAAARLERRRRRWGAGGKSIGAARVEGGNVERNGAELVGVDLVVDDLELLFGGADLAAAHATTGAALPPPVGAALSLPTAPPILFLPNRSGSDGWENELGVGGSGGLPELTRRRPLPLPIFVGALSTPNGGSGADRPQRCGLDLVHDGCVAVAGAGPVLVCGGCVTITGADPVLSLFPEGHGTRNCVGPEL